MIVSFVLNVTSEYHHLVGGDVRIIGMDHRVHHSNLLSYKQSVTIDKPCAIEQQPRRKLE